jgi:hypothetical protein
MIIQVLRQIKDQLPMIRMFAGRQVMRLFQAIKAL